MLLRITTVAELAQLIRAAPMDFCSKGSHTANMFLLALGFVCLLVFLALMPEGGIQVALAGFWAVTALVFAGSIVYSLGGLLFS